MIENQKKSYGGEFLFVEANIDAVETAKHFGISANRAGDCLKDKRTAVYYDKRGLYPKFCVNAEMRVKQK